ncbi:hypothetical protein EYR40_002979 [Pleurotus pulmonarius]|nr:hypothetical protein EYR40_002979 [Pleurotus pulmonarius]
MKMVRSANELILVPLLILTSRKSNHGQAKSGRLRIFLDHQPYQVRISVAVLNISQTCSSSGWASQWYPASFTAVVTMNASAEEVTFPSTEHWMMFQKALLFGDHAIAREVAGMEGTSKGDMAYVKSLGRKVKNFDDETWKLHRERIVFEGNLHKFRQHAELKSKLLATGEKEIVEASPHDKIWGIGHSEQAAISRGGLKWGLNLLGKALVQVREALKQEDAAENL